MRYIIVGALLAAALFRQTAVAQETPPGMVSTYEALADTIIAVKRAETGFVRALLEGYRHAARATYERGDYEAAAANIALFANEGDNAIAGVRKRLVDAGHHHHHASDEGQHHTSDEGKHHASDAGKHHASDEGAPAYDPGFVFVDRASKAVLLAAAAKMRGAGDEASASEAWKSFETTAGALLGAK